MTEQEKTLRITLRRAHISLQDVGIRSWETCPQTHFEFTLKAQPFSEIKDHVPSRTADHKLCKGQTRYSF